MDKTRFSELKQSLIEASEIARGVRSPARIWVRPDLKKFREGQGLSLISKTRIFLGVPLVLRF